MTRSPVLLAVLLIVAVGEAVYIGALRSELAALRRAPVDPQVVPAPRTAAGPRRTLSDEQRQAMLGVLREETSPVRKVWFQVEQNKPEPLAYQQALEGVFKEAGWEVETKGAGGMTFKPGVYLLVAEEEWPPYASTAYDAFQKAGIEVKAARGYRAYSDQQRKEKPGWQGPELAADQSYVVLVGASPGS